MGFSKEDEHRERVAEKDERFFIEGSSGSEDDSNYSLNCQQSRRHSTRSHRPRTDASPPLVLAFSLPTTAGQEDYCTSPASTASSDSSFESDFNLEDQEENIEEWMILGGEELEGDAHIQLNLVYASSSEEEEAEENSTVKELGCIIALKNTWAVSDKDKWGVNQPLSSRYFSPDRSLRCYNCNRTGHLAKSCSTPKRRPTCVLCGHQGHVQRGCLRPHCPSCGLPSHGQLACPEPPLWSQHCHRCGLTGHLTDACTDTWRQYHQTTQKEVPPRPPTNPAHHTGHTHRTSHAHHHRPGRRPAHCYNCSRRGHLGHECVGRRMVSGTFPVTPFVCHYDTLQDLLQQDTRIRRKAKELREKGFHLRPGRHTTLEPAGGSGDEKRSAPSTPSQRRSRSVELWAKEGQGKTWPEKRRERREVKKLRREAQARREGGVVVPAHQTYPSQPHKHRESHPPPKKRRRMYERKERRSSKEHRRKSKRSREEARWS